jgi:hypothetical protein
MIIERAESFLGMMLMKLSDCFRCDTLDSRAEWQIFCFIQYFKDTSSFYQQKFKLGDH